MSGKNGRHKSVLLNEVMDLLDLRPGDNVIDCTLGDGGHAELILNKIAPDGRLLGIDADPESILRSKQFLYSQKEKIEFVRDNFVNLSKIVHERKFGKVKAVLIDLGWSMPQFSERNRGYSFRNSTEYLDMRYEGKGDGPTAADILNNAAGKELEEIIRLYGDEKLAAAIAKKIVEKRKLSPIRKVKDLVDIILEVYRDKLKTNKSVPWIGGIHPATKTFQALRIAVNNELEVLKETLPQAIDVLAKRGRLAVISFHSLEDGIVKHYFKSTKSINIITKKPVCASPAERKINPRSRSAKLRVVEKL